MPRRKPAEARPNEELTFSYNNMMAVDSEGKPTSKKKRYCIGCGGPRDVEFAETHPCGCCGSTGTQKTMPLFDEHGERIVEQPEAAPKQRKAVVEEPDFSTSLVVRPIGAPAQAKFVEAKSPKTERLTTRQPNIQNLPKPKPAVEPTKVDKRTAAANLAALFG